MFPGMMEKFCGSLAIPYLPLKTGSVIGFSCLPGPLLILGK